MNTYLEFFLFFILWQASLNLKFIPTSHIYDEVHCECKRRRASFLHIPKVTKNLPTPPPTPTLPRKSKLFT